MGDECCIVSNECRVRFCKVKVEINRGDQIGIRPEREIQLRGCQVSEYIRDFELTGNIDDCDECDAGGKVSETGSALE